MVRMSGDSQGSPSRPAPFSSATGSGPPNPAPRAGGGGRPAGGAARRPGWEPKSASGDDSSGSRTGVLHGASRAGRVDTQTSPLPDPPARLLVKKSVSPSADTSGMVSSSPLFTSARATGAAHGSSTRARRAAKISPPRL